MVRRQGKIAFVMCYSLVSVAMASNPNPSAT